MVVILPIVFLLGLCIGSFSNVLIYRLPKGENFVTVPSHCMHCGHRLSGFDMIPLISWLCLGGKCRYCKGKVSAQYPIVEGVTGLLYLLTGFLMWGRWLEMALYLALSSLLLVLSVIDWRTFEIPNGISLSIFVLGLIRLLTDLGNWPLYAVGCLAVGLVFLMLHLLTGGNGLGMGDVKLVAAAGLLLGWPRMILGILVGSIAGIVIHSIRMTKGAGKKLAFGPYLSAGIWFAAVAGERLIEAYLSLFGL